MQEIDIYQVFEYEDDIYSPYSEEHGYFKDIDNAIKKVKEVIYSEDKVHVEINRQELLESGLYSYIVSETFGDKHVIGIWKIETDD